MQSSHVKTLSVMKIHHQQTRLRVNTANTNCTTDWDFEITVASSESLPLILF